MLRLLMAMTLDDALEPLTLQLDSAIAIILESKSLFNIVECRDALLSVFGGSAHLFSCFFVR